MDNDLGSGRSLLVAWAKEKDDWLRQIVADVIESRSPLSDDRVQAAYEQLLIQKRLASGQRQAPPALADLSGECTPEKRLSLHEINGVKNVNALASGQAIAFNSKMTVLFGRNGSGKTGYARILKRLSSVRREERILPNITEQQPSKEPPEATIRYRLDAEECSLQWGGEAGVAPFTRMDVFDAREAPLHTDGQLTYLYTPADVALFRYVAASLEKVRAKLDDAKKASAPGQNTFTVHFARDLDFYGAIDTLGATTDVAALWTLGSVTDDELSSLDSLQNTIDALSSRSLQAEVQQVQADCRLCEQACAVGEELLNFQTIPYNQAVQALAEATAKRRAATTDALLADAIPGVLSPQWQAFIEAGERYLGGLAMDGYPAQDDPCLYCRQPLTAEAVALLLKYRDFCNGEHEKAVVAATETLDRLRAAFSDDALRNLAHLTQQKAASLDAGAAESEVLKRAQLIQARAIEASQRVAANTPLVTPIADDTLADSVAQLRSKYATLATLLDSLQGKSDERAGSLSAARAQKAAIESRAALKKHLPAIVAFVEKAKWVSVADDVLRQMKSAAKTLTDAAKEASERLVNQDFERLFRAECKSLGAPHVQLDFRGQRGEPARRKMLRAEYQLSDTLSEGEQKVIALADFLAEASLRGNTAPVVFDDPVTSLDYEHVHEVATRLAALASERQVVVFTHNIWFAVTLLECFRDRRQECGFYDVRAVDERRGVVSGGTHPRSDSLNELKKRINRTIDDAKKAAGETQDALISRGYSVLRALCEVAVESELLGGIIRRYEPNVRLTVLPDIKPVALKVAGERIHHVYEATCRYIDSHSQPLEHLNIVRNASELERDYRTVVEAIDNYKKAPA